MKARDGAFDMDDTASHNQVVARNFQEKFAIQELGTRPFDLCPTVGVVKNGDCQPSPVIECNDGSLENRPPAELPLIPRSFYCQVSLDIIVRWNARRRLASASKLLRSPPRGVAKASRNRPIHYSDSPALAEWWARWRTERLGTYPIRVESS